MKQVFNSRSRIHCSSACHDILQKLGGYELSARGVTSIKGKTDQMTYWLVREDPYIRARRDGGMKSIYDVHKFDTGKSIYTG